MDVLSLLALLTVHFVGDFLLQSNWIATHKAKRWDVLTLHVLMYALCFWWWGSTFVLVTFVTHWLTDAVTAPIVARFYFVKENSYGGLTVVAVDDASRHWFFVLIALDQLIHAWTLGLTYLWLVAS